MSLQNKFLSKELSDKFWKEGLTLATAESCTAGNIAAVITAIPGSSHFYKGGIVAYSDEVKINLLGVNPETLDKHGAVSEEAVIEMVKGAMKSMNSDCAVATSGIAGPTGGTPDKPIGTVWIAAAIGEKVITMKASGDEGRMKNIENATLHALQMLQKLFQNQENEQ
ncbi:MAG: CinA family protein [Bacteroides sp.]|nr:CinA family protein [Bacteroides sp.]